MYSLITMRLRWAGASIFFNHSRFHFPNGGLSGIAGVAKGDQLLQLRFLLSSFLQLTVATSCSLQPTIAATHMIFNLLRSAFLGAAEVGIFYDCHPHGHHIMKKLYKKKRLVIQH